MVAISSHRPLDESREVAINQIRAHTSWLPVFDEIVYFGRKEAALESDETSFVECEPFPHISTLAQAASLTDNFACIINADIVVSTHLRKVINQVLERGGYAVTSRRWQFNGNGLVDAYLHPEDFGIDFFGTTPQMWRQISKQIPAYYRIGHNCWDTWVVSFLNTMLPGRFFNITEQRCIYHPLHGDRKRVYDIAPTEDKYTRHCGFPNRRL